MRGVWGISVCVYLYVLKDSTLLFQTSFRFFINIKASKCVRVCLRACVCVRVCVCACVFEESSLSFHMHGVFIFIN